MHDLKELRFKYPNLNHWAVQDVGALLLSGHAAIALHVAIVPKIAFTRT